MDTCVENPKFIDSDRQKIIHVDIDPRNAGWVFPAEVCLCGDAKLVMSQLISGLTGNACRMDRTQALQKRKEKVGFLDDPSLRSDAIPILPQRVVAEIEKAVDASAIIVTDGGNNRHWMSHFFKTKAVDSYFGAGGIGGVSWSVAAVLTAKLLHPDRPCICVCGDGGFAMQIHVLSTALQYKTPVIFVIMNDSRFGMVGESQGTRRIGTDFIDTDFAKIANAFGCQGIRVKQPEEIAPALERALKSEVPMVIDVIINREEKMYGKLLSPLAKEALKEIGFRQEMKGEGFKG
jgi:acetolactate synthase-1/2/3 large subunit